MIDGSESIAYAAYDSGWEEVPDKDYRNMLRLVMLRAQRPVKMRAFRFIVISLEAVVIVSFVQQANVVVITYSFADTSCGLRSFLISVEHKGTQSINGC